MTGKQYLLDTNLLIHYVRDTPLWRWIGTTYQLFVIEPVPMVSVVSHGELRSFAMQNDWGRRKLDQMEFCLEYFRRMTIDTDRVIQTYARIDHFSLQFGRSMGKNDLWIAATAAVEEAALLTTDRDYEHLVPAFLDWQWIDPRPPLQ